MSYWQKWYQRKVDEKICPIIADNFAGGTLITLRHSNLGRISDSFIARSWKAWLDCARRQQGGGFRYIVGHDYGTTEAPAMVHYVFTDIPVIECKRMANAWVCGAAEVMPLDQQTLTAVLAFITNRPTMQRKVSRPLWGTSRKVACKIPNE